MANLSSALVAEYGRTDAQRALLLRGQIDRAAATGWHPQLYGNATERALGKRTPSPSTLHDRDVAGVFDDFVGLIRRDDPRPANAFVETLFDQGWTLESIYLDLLRPAARHLGVLWERDDCTFADVTLGLWALHRLVREFSPAFCAPDIRNHAATDANIFLTTLPGAQHSFGLLLVAEFFRRAGWSVTSGPVRSERDLAARVGGRDFAVIGLSIACKSELDGLRSCVRLARRKSRNRTAAILVGGRVFDEDPSLALCVGADGHAGDPNVAIRVAARLAGLEASRAERPVLD